MKLSSALRYLEKKTNSIISIHILHAAFLDCEALHLAPDQYLHHGEFCRRTKMHGNFQTCVANKAKSLKKAATGVPFSGKCPFGIWDYAHPVCRNQELIAVIYLGYFRKKEASLRNSPPGWNEKEIPLLTPEIESELQHAGNFLSDLIQMEIGIWTEAGGMDRKQKTPDFYVKNTLFFIDCHFSKNISVEDAADTLHVTPNHLGEIIHRETGKNFRNLLTERRLKEACVYLRLHHELSITRIAAICGFPDSNYFSFVFHKNQGVTPREYRITEYT